MCMISISQIAVIVKKQLAMTYAILTHQRSIDDRVGLAFFPRAKGRRSGSIAYSIIGLGIAVA